MPRPLRAGIEAVPAVTLEAASSLAFSSRQLLWNVQLPLAVRFALPSLINNLIDLVKMTAVASAIAVGDITYASIMIWTQSDNVLELMILLLAFFRPAQLRRQLCGPCPRSQIEDARLWPLIHP
jgi:polar amino acid transport system permease protein